MDRPIVRVCEECALGGVRAVDGCVGSVGGQRALPPPPAKISVIVWTPDLQPHQKSLHVQLLLITGDSTKQCLHSPCSLSLSLGVCLCFSLSLSLSLLHMAIFALCVINALQAWISRNLVTALSGAGDMFFPSFHTRHMWKVLVQPGP